LDIVEVSPRDGLQNEASVMTTDQKLQLIDRCIDAGARRIEATSFVSPRAVPALADADELMTRVPRDRGVKYSALILNQRGLDRAIAANVDEINFVVVASETLSQRNQGAGIAESLHRWAVIAPAARAAGIKPTLTIAVSFGCPFEGNTPPHRVADIAAQAAESEPGEISLADTIGVASPAEVLQLVPRIRAVAPGVPLRCHFHDTRHTGIANAYAALLAGVETLDSSLGGIGGCPFAPGATGNVATEDLVYVFDRMGEPTGLDLNQLVQHAEWVSQTLGISLAAAVGRAGVYPAEPSCEPRGSV
jgi:hydroxymethylglutaryl-CoA lyase